MKPSPLTLIALRHSTKHPVQSLLLILGIALGVAMIVAIDLANGSAKQAFALSTDAIAGKTTHQITAAPTDLPSTLYRDLRLKLGLRNIAPIVSGLVLLPQADKLPLQLLGVDPFAEAPFRNYLGDGAGNLSFNALTQLLIQPNTILMPTSLAAQYGLKAGDSLDLVISGQSKTVKIVGLLNPGDSWSQRALSGLLLCDLSTAQELLNKTGHLSRIDLILPTDPSLESVEIAKITAVLPPNAQLQRANLRSQTINQMTAAFELNLSALSFLALIVGMFLIYNTISFSVVQRRPILGTLRCLGVTRRELFGLVLTEALVLSALGATIGLGLGVLLGRGLVGLVTQTINDLFFTVTVQNVDLSPLTLYKGFMAGLVAGLVAAFIPALEAMTVPPNSALKRSMGEDRLQQLLPIITTLGLLSMSFGGLLLWLITAYLAVSFVAVTFILVGAAFLTPLITQTLIRLFTPITHYFFGVIGLMAARDITRALSRTSVTIAALMLSVTVIIGVSVMVDSFRSTVIAWLDDILAADIYVSPVGEGRRVQAALDPALITAMQQLDGVQTMSLLQETRAFSPEHGEVEVRASSPQPNEPRRRFLWAIGTSAEVFAALEQGDMMVSEVFARRLKLPLNQPSTLNLRTDKGVQPFRIVAIFYDYTLPEVGYVAMRLTTYQRYWQDRNISNLGLYLTLELAPQADLITEQLRADFAGKYALTISSDRGIKQGALEVFDRTFTITAALRLLATVVAFIGVLSALMSLQLERTRELGTLRANGMSLPQLWGKTLLETGLMGFTAGLMAMPVGLVLAVILIYVINLRSFGWTLQLYLTPSIFVTAMFVAISAALLAAIYPVIRLSRMEIAAALREE